MVLPGSMNIAPPAGAAADYAESFVLRGVHVDFVFERLEFADDHGRSGPFPETQGGFAGSGSHFACPFDVEVHLFLRFAGVVVHDVRFECVPASRVFRPIAGFGDFAGSNGSSVFVAFRGSSFSMFFAISAVSAVSIGWYAAECAGRRVVPLS